MKPTASDLTLRPLSEAEFQRQVTDLAEIHGFLWCHFRPAQTSKGWRTPVSGPLGKGWVDLILVHPVSGRLIFAELKRDGAKPRLEQNLVLMVLGAIDGAEVKVWHPSDFDDVVATLAA